jgi:hypothetical protein
LNCVGSTWCAFRAIDRSSVLLFEEGNGCTFKLGGLRLAELGHWSSAWRYHMYISRSGACSVPIVWSDVLGAQQADSSLHPPPPTYTPRLCHCARYTSPEVKAGDTEAGSAADLYSFGVLLCEAVLTYLHQLNREEWAPDSRTTAEGLRGLLGGRRGEFLTRVPEQDRAWVNSLIDVARSSCERWPGSRGAATEKLRALAGPPWSSIGPASPPQTAPLIASAASARSGVLTMRGTGVVGLRNEPG